VAVTSAYKRDVLRFSSPCFFVVVTVLRVTAELVIAAPYRVRAFCVTARTVVTFSLLLAHKRLLPSSFYLSPATWRLYLACKTALPSCHIAYYFALPFATCTTYTVLYIPHFSVGMLRCKLPACCTYPHYTTYLLRPTYCASWYPCHILPCCGLVLLLSYLTYLSLHALAMLRGGTWCFWAAWDEAVSPCVWVIALLPV